MVIVLLSAALAATPPYRHSAIWPALDRFEQLRIDGPAAPGTRHETDVALQAQLAQARSALASFEQAAEAVISSPATHEEGLAALGRAYEHMAVMLLSSYVPAYLTAEQAEVYALGLEDMAYAQEEKAIGAYQRLLDTTDACTDWERFALDQMAALRPGELGPVKLRVPPALPPHLAPAYDALACNDFTRAEQHAQGGTLDDRLVLAIVRHYQGQTRAAEKHFAVLVRKSPGDLAVACNAAYFYALALQDHRRALRALEKAVSRHPHLPPSDPTFALLAWVQADRARLDRQRAEAREAWAQAAAERQELDALIAKMDVDLERIRACASPEKDALVDFGEMLQEQLHLIREAGDVEVIADLRLMVSEFQAASGAACP